MARQKSQETNELGFPSHVQAFGVRFEVILRDDLESDNSAFGLVKFKGKQLLIDSALDYSQQVSTLIHEIIEIANEHMELGLEHRAICSLEVVIHQGLTSSGMIRGISADK